MRMFGLFLESVDGGNIALVFFIVDKKFLRGFTHRVRIFSSSRL